ncbi:response regulator transcription factor [Amycolatopsis sp. Poz14]|nr:response regulator transcription factor [Amycolatopsis sp. Poz14]
MTTGRCSPTTRRRRWPTGSSRSCTQSRRPRARAVRSCRDERISYTGRVDGEAAYRPQLGERELRVLRLVAEGYSNSEIAAELGWSEHTVKNALYDLMARLGVRNRAHAAAYAVRNGLI